MINRFDLIIVGAGPIGLACAIEAKKKGLSHLVIEKGVLVNSIFNYPVNMTFFSTSEKLEIGDVPFISHGIKPARAEALEYYRRVKANWQLNVRTYEKVESVNKKDRSFEVKTEKGIYNAGFVIIASGFYDFPNMMNIPGEDLPKVKHYYKEPHPYADQKIVIIGGGNSAVDVALETYRRGAEVTLVLRKDNLEENVKYWVRPDIENRIKEGDIKLYKNSSVSEIRLNEVDIETSDGKVTIENDFVLAMTGYHPDFSFLKSCGVELNTNNGNVPVYNSETFETSIEGLYLAGVVCSGFDTGKLFIENTRYHAENIMKDIKKQ
jgi:thioredoxin reductase (NADPH)